MPPELSDRNPPPPSPLHSPRSIRSVHDPAWPRVRVTHRALASIAGGTYPAEPRRVFLLPELDTRKALRQASRRERTNNLWSTHKGSKTGVNKQPASLDHRRPKPARIPTLTPPGSSLGISLAGLSREANQGRPRGNVANGCHNTRVTGEIGSIAGEMMATRQGPTTSAASQQRRSVEKEG